MRIRESKRLMLCVVLLAAILVTGCETFSGLVPGLQAVRSDVSDVRLVMIDVQAEITGVTDELKELIAHGDIVDQEAAERLVERFDKVEETVAKVEQVVTGVEENLVAAGEEAQKLADEKFDLWGLADMGLELGTYAGVPGLGIVSLVLNRLRKKANRTTETVIRGVEVARNGGDEINWEQLALVHERAGVSDVVRAIRKKHKAEAEAAKLAAGEAVKA